MKEKLRSSLGKVTFELTIVTLGVLIALVINEWFQNYQEERHAHVILEKTHYELKGNLDALRRTQKSFEETMPYLDELIARDNYPDDAQYSLQINYLEIHSSVWEFALQRGELRELPVELLLPIASSYQFSKEAQVASQKLNMAALSRFGLEFSQSENQKSLLKNLRLDMANAIYEIRLAVARLERTLENTGHFLEQGYLNPNTEVETYTIEVQ